MNNHVSDREGYGPFKTHEPGYIRPGAGREVTEGEDHLGLFDVYYSAIYTVIPIYARTHTVHFIE